MGDYVAVIMNKSKEKDQEIFLFQVKKKMDAEDDPNAAWAGSLADIKKNVDKNIQTLGIQIEKKIERVYTGQLETRTNLNKLEKESISQHSTIMSELSDMMSIQKTTEKKNVDLQNHFSRLM